MGRDLEIDHQRDFLPLVSISPWMGEGAGRSSPLKR